MWRTSALSTVFVAFGFGISCKDNTLDCDDMPAPQSENAPTDDECSLAAWLEDERYAQWPAESQVHASAGPHFGDVRTFINTPLNDSLQAQAAAHPVGATAVKELYGDGDTVQGWAVMSKLTEEGEGGAWYWFELYQDELKADGTGVGVCVNCHESGSDFVLTGFPLQ